MPEPQQIVRCSRCGRACRVSPVPGSRARVLRRSRHGGYCVDCATHDFLRNTYPLNVQLAESGPSILLHPQMREVFAGVLRAGESDAEAGEINWNAIVELWELPFDEPVRPSPTNPVSQEQLDEVTAGNRPGLRCRRRRPDPLGDTGTITSFEDINKLEPGLGDALREQLDRGIQRGHESANPDQADDGRRTGGEDTQKWLF